MFAPDILHRKLNQLDTLFDVIEGINPELSSYIIKPTDLINTFMSDGPSGVIAAFTNRAGKLKEGMPEMPNSIMPTLTAVLTSQFLNEGATIETNKELQWDIQT